jgi:hypothetical protein
MLILTQQAAKDPKRKGSARNCAVYGSVSMEVYLAKRTGVSLFDSREVGGTRVKHIF